MKNIFPAATAFTLLLVPGLVLAGEKPPENAVPLSEIVKSLETSGYSPITEVSIDDGIWEVEAYKDGEERDLKVDPVNGEVISDRPDH